MDNGVLSGAVFLDLSKAFGTVGHRILLHKLKSIGLTPVAVGWWHSYLTYRKQVTSVGHAHSPAAPATVGVPQGSILGPLLILIYGGEWSPIMSPRERHNVVHRWHRHLLFLSHNCWWPNEQAKSVATKPLSLNGSWQPVDPKYIKNANMSFSAVDRNLRTYKKSRYK